jgi:membrane-bound lytic murein transglycosylase F
LKIAGITKRCLPALLLLSLASACGTPDESPPFEGNETPPFIEAGDLQQIDASGTLRVLYPQRSATRGLPRKGRPLEQELELVQEYAKQRGLETVFVFVESREDLIPDLLAGNGDLIAANLTVTPTRKEQVAFTVPVAVVREQLVTRPEDTELNDPEDLIDRRIAVRRSSSFWNTVQALKTSQPGIWVDEMPENLDTEELIHRVALGDLDVTVADSNLLAACREYRDDFRTAFDLTEDRPIAWAVRPGSVELLTSLNRFLSAEALTERSAETFVGDLDSIKERKVLRVLTRNNAVSYFLWRGQLLGFEYDLAQKFARDNGLRLEMVVPPGGEDLLTWLVEGRGDMIAAAFSPTEERLASGAGFSRPYNYVSHAVVARADEALVKGPLDLAGRTFFVRRSSAYWESLSGLKQSGVALNLVAVPEDFETEDIIDGVAGGQYDLTLADSHILDIELAWRDDVKRLFTIGDPVPLTWVARASNPELLGAMDRFINAEYRGLFYNLKYQQYFKNASRIRSHVQNRFEVAGGFSPYDETIKKYAEQYGFDWRLIVSQIYQESRFAPDARSFAGARGLMQVMPRTAESMGFTDLDDPETSIHAGIRYMDWVRDRFEPELPVRERMWFTLAGYNAGPGHVRDARRLAAQMGLNPNQWFGNVESSMLLLSRQTYADKAPHGYCRCAEPVKYVREIRERYDAYIGTLASL